MLLSTIPMAVPTSTAMVAVPGYPGCFKYDVDQLKDAPVMDWSQHFELGRQAATGEWTPEPNVPQVAANLPGPDLLPLSAVPEIEQQGGFDMVRIPERVGATLVPGIRPSSDLGSWTLNTEESAEYAGAWSTVSIEFARSMLNTGIWDNAPITPAQRKAAHDFMEHMAPSGPRRAQLENV